MNKMLIFCAIDDIALTIMELTKMCKKLFVRVNNLCINPLAHPNTFAQLSENFVH